MVVLCVPIPVPISVHDREKDKDDDDRRSRSLAVKHRNLCLVGTLICLVFFVFAVKFDQRATTPAEAQHNTGDVKTATIANALPTLSTPFTQDATKPICATKLFVDLEFTRKRHGTKKPKISIIFITKRPGGYDFLLHSLNQQIITLAAYKNLPVSEIYELICVDELSSYRSTRIYEMAKELNVPLVAVAPSKPKAAKFMTSHFNLYNAVNTGLLFSRGSIVTFVMDYAWLPANYIDRTLEFYDIPERAKSFLAYPERFFRLTPNSIPPSSAMTDWDSVTLFPTNITQPLSKYMQTKGDLSFTLGYTRPQDLVTDFLNNQAHGFEKQPRLNSPQGKDTFWELSFASCPFSALEALNGAEEMWDVGDDSHEANIRLRAEFLGYDLWVDGQVVVECMWHKNQLQPQGDLWNRFSENTVSGPVIITEMGEINRHERSVVSAGHEFNLTTWRANDCAGRLGL